MKQVFPIIFLAFVLVSCKKNLPDAKPISIDSEPVMAGKLDGKPFIKTKNITTSTFLNTSSNIFTVSFRCNFGNDYQVEIVDTLPSKYFYSSGQIIDELPESEYLQIFKPNGSVKFYTNDFLETEKKVSSLKVILPSTFQVLVTSFGNQNGSNLEIIDSKIVTLPNGYLGIKVYARFNCKVYFAPTSNGNT